MFEISKAASAVTFLKTGCFINESQVSLLRP